MTDKITTLSPAERDAMLHTLKARFERHMDRHRGVTWTQVLERLAARPETLQTLAAMEQTGGEPDVVACNQTENTVVQPITFMDCSAESPAGRRSLCYDRAAMESRKENKPAGSVLDMAAGMGISLLTEEQYRKLQQCGVFDCKTSSWIMTPPDIRKLGGALFCDRRYGHVFVYHNGAESYYSARGFRGCLVI